MTRILLACAVVVLAACPGSDSSNPDAGSAPDAAAVCTGVPRTPSIASCKTGVPNPQQCLEFTGAGWTTTTAMTGCSQDFSTTTVMCPTAFAVGRCLRNCGLGMETVETFYSNGPTAFNAAIAEAVCNGYTTSDPVAPIFLP